jgi:dihydroxyacetone kinase DhaKLM complex PTS-EIIA-like component DhaM
VERGTPPYPLFRKVSGLGGEEATYQLFSRDIHRFLSREEKEILLDIGSINMHYNTAAKILEYETAHFTRKAIIDVLEAITKKSEVSKEKKNKELLHA